jgi:nitrite reductase/ring-hydroxylating ferredoxin subunit
VSDISSPTVQRGCRVHTACYSVGTGLCLELNRGGVVRAVNWYRFGLDLEESG